MHYNTLTLRKASVLYLFIALLFSTNIFAQSLSGYYTLGGETSDFPTFRSAIHKLDSFGISGPVVFKVKDGVYYESDTIRHINGTSADNTITFQSDSRDSSAVVIEWNSQKSGNWNLWLNRAGFIIFKNIGFRQLYDQGKQNVHLIECHNITFQNCLFEGSNMVMDGALLTGTVDSNLTISGCNFAYARRGIDLYAGKKGTANNIRIEGTTIHTQNSGITLASSSNTQIEKNKLFNITGGAYAGVLIKKGSRITIAGNEINVQANADNTRALDLNGLMGDSLAPCLIYNNILKVSAQDGKNVFALKTGNFSNTIISNNTLVLSADNSQLAVVGFCPEPNGVSNSSFINNIVANTGTGPAFLQNANVGKGLINDYNLWYSGSGAITTDHTNIAELVASDSSNQHSYFQDPVFVHPDTLIAGSLFIDSNAFPVSAITEDYFGNKRNSQYPDIGAFERLHLPEVNLPKDTAACQTLTLYVDGKANWYNWSTGSHHDSISISNNDYYWVTAINGDGYVTDSCYVTINQPQPFTIVANQDSIMPGQCVNLSTSFGTPASLPVVWSDASGRIGNQGNLVVCPQTLPATYTAELLDTNGCTSQKTITIYQGQGNSSFVHKTNEPNSSNSNAQKVETNSEPVTKSSTANPTNKANQINEPVVFPNPAHNLVSVQFNNPLPEEPTLLVSDLAGNYLHAFVTPQGNNTFQLDISRFASGSYILIVQTSTNIYRKELVKVSR